MDFSLGTQQEMLRDTVRRFFEAEVAPIARACDDEERFPREMIRQWGELGLIGIRYPEADGGSGFDKLSECLAREEMSRVSQGFASTWSVQAHLGSWPLWRAGTPEQKARYFAPALSGEKIACFGLSEPEGGSNIRALRTRAARVPGGWRISGSKLYITNAPLADYMLLCARTRPELTPEAVSIFVVDLPNPGIVIHKLAKEGIRASETGLIHIDEAFVPDEALLGDREGTYPIILDSLSENRVGVAANCVGMAQGAFEAALAYARDREVGGKRIGQYQAIAHKLADMAAEIDAARLMVHHGAWRIDQGTLDAPAAAKVKLVASECALRVTEQAIRIHGGAGIMRDHAVGRFHRDALVYVIGEGTSEIQRNIIARDLRL
jgi:alkylation response protein AidB-like acyl-CoA dehydrogenase